MPIMLALLLTEFKYCVSISLRVVLIWISARSSSLLIMPEFVISGLRKVSPIRVLLAQ